MTDYDDVSLYGTPGEIAADNAAIQRARDALKAKMDAEYQKWSDNCDLRMRVNALSMRQHDLAPLKVLISDCLDIEDFEERLDAIRRLFEYILEIPHILGLYPPFLNLVQKKLVEFRADERTRGLTNLFLQVETMVGLLKL
jgi:hypothetical protein